MSNFLCITFRFIQPFPLFHGRTDSDVAEWPPSPMRAFQALLCAACSRNPGTALTSEVRSVLQTLELLRPEIIAPQATVSTVGYRAYVPHNQTDLVTFAWHRGNIDANIAEYRMEKDVRPMRIDSIEDEPPALLYVYPLHSIDVDPHAMLATIRPVVRSIHCLGWGIDQVVADAVLLDENPVTPDFNERWHPVSFGGRRLRVPVQGSLDALLFRHEKFLSRLLNNIWTPVPPLSATMLVGYRRHSDPAPRPHTVFKLVDEYDDTVRCPHAKLFHIAAMARQLAIRAMDAESGSPPPWIKDQANWVTRVVHGIRDESSEDQHKQFSYIPLPSIGHAHADAMIRNVMIIAPLDMERELNYVAERLDGLALDPKGYAASCKTESTLQLPGRVELQRFTPPRGRFIAKCYLGSSSVWETVTPVILDGCNRKSKSDKPEVIARRTQKLICKALFRAGIATPCEFTWQSIPFLKNTLSAHKYDRQGRRTGYIRPPYLDGYTAVHLRINFGYRKVSNDPESAWLPIDVPGPITIGAGRHCGFGLLATANTN